MKKIPNPIRKKNKVQPTKVTKSKKKKKVYPPSSTDQPSVRNDVYTNETMSY